MLQRRWRRREEDGEEKWRGRRKKKKEKIQPPKDKFGSTRWITMCTHFVFENNKKNYKKWKQTNKQTKKKQ